MNQLCRRLPPYIARGYNNRMRCGCRQNGAFASALAGMVPEKLAKLTWRPLRMPNPNVQAFALNVSLDFLPRMLPARSLACFKSCRKLA
jgi:hypothetical protein